VNIARSKPIEMLGKQIAVEIGFAVTSDATELQSLLFVCGLSSHGLFAPDALYWTARTANGRLIGCSGLEISGQAGLLRSVAVSEDARGLGVAQRIVECVLAESRKRSIRHVYLFSKDSGGFFEKLGWLEAPVPEAAQALATATQVRHYDRTGWYPNERAFRRDVM